MVLPTPRRGRAIAAAILALCVLALGWPVACSQVADSERLAQADGAVTQPSDASELLLVASRVASLSPMLAPRLSPRPSGGWQRDADGVVSPGWRNHRREPTADVVARLPAHSGSTLEVGISADPRFLMAVGPLGERPVAVQLDEGRAVYADAHPSTDIIVVAEPQRVEWFYLLKDTGAPTHFRVPIELPAGLPTARVTAAGSIEFLDEGGEVRLIIPRPTAVDDRGTEREATLELMGDEIRVELDVTGLVHPILLDPAVETPIWQVRDNPPSSRGSMGMAFDESRGVVVMFGGQAGSSVLRDTWEWGGDSWTLRSTTGPSARRNAQLGWDQMSARVLLYGGQDAGGMWSTDTWTWTGVAWTQTCASGVCGLPPVGMWSNLVNIPGYGLLLWQADSPNPFVRETYKWTGASWISVDTQATSPPRRTGAAMASLFWPPGAVLFGGANEFGVDQNDTWVFSALTQTWALQPGLPGDPPPRRDAAMAYDPQSGGVLLFGGLSPGGMSDSWVWRDGAGWMPQVSFNSPPGRWSHGMVYDAYRSTVVLFGGSGLGDTWERSWWGEWSAVGAPSPRNSPGIAYDSGRSRVVLFGGVAGAALNDVWEFSGYAWDRACSSALCASTVPQPRYAHAMGYDSARGVTVVHGGYGSGVGHAVHEYNGVQWSLGCGGSGCFPAPPGIGADPMTGHTMAFYPARGKMVMIGGSPDPLWELDATAWTNVPATGGPGSRWGAGSAYSPVLGGVVVFGGYSLVPVTTYHADTWLWDGTSWQQLCATCSGPSARSGHHVAYDSARRRLIVTGGTDAGGTHLSDTWELDANGTSWTARAGATPGQVANGGMVYDPARRRTVLFGGTAPTGNRGSTWDYFTRGGACFNGSTCDVGYCVDGVCCESPSCGSCEACDTVTRPGVCTTITGADDPDSCTGAVSCSALGECKADLGESCSVAGDCASGQCVSGVCCDTACDEGCGVCFGGTCVARGAGTTGSCGGLLCQGNVACPTTCTDDSQCTSDTFCAFYGACVPRRAAGDYCNVDAGSGDCAAAAGGCRVCDSGLSCAPGFVCCNTACDGVCKSCETGTCTTVTSAQDFDSCSGNASCDALGLCKRNNGELCTAGSQCATGFCADGVCCDTACTGACGACDRVGSVGSCEPDAAGATGSPSCSPRVCDGNLTTCPSTCSSDAQCAAGYYCNPSGACIAQRTQGQTCNPTADCRVDGCRLCASGNCVDGYCCNATCGDACDGCDGAARGWSGASNGTCAVAPAGFAGGPACGAYACNGTATTCATACTADLQCGGGHYCASNGTCQPQRTGGQSCNLATDCRVAGCRECSTGNCVDGVCCNTPCSGACDVCNVTAGICAPASAGSAGTPACAPYLCNGAAAGCPTACSSDAQCAATHYCNTASGLCEPDGAQGVACSTGAQCQTGLFCVDGVCCDTTCTGLCQACSAARKGQGSSGTCGPVAAGVDVDGDCTDQGAATCGSNGFCDGVGQCQRFAVGVVCGANSCTGSTLSGAQCNGTGSCVASTSSCGLYACSGSACATSCTADGQCSASAWCRTSDGSCQPDQAQGAPCGAGSQCTSGYCVDGVCCQGACAGACQACSAVKKGSGLDGECGPVPAATDPDSECAAESTTSCGQNGQCNGAGACARWALGTTCGTTLCAAGLQTGQACDGAGTCVSGSSTACAPYACGATACLATCTGDADCVGAFYCVLATGTCAADLANGSACTAGTQCQSGQCVDGVCCDAPCNGSCEACSTAKKGGGANGVCGNVGAGSDPDNECNPDLPGTCQRNGACDGSGNCQLYSPGTACGSSTCGASLSTGYQCNGFGSCVSGSTVNCAPFACSGNVCGTTCSDDAGCVGTSWCRIADGTCQPDQSNGAACTAAGQCQSGNCADGVCCDSPCGGRCQACSAALKGGGVDGACGNVPVGQDPDNECSTDSPTSCGQEGTCDGAGGCRRYAPGVPCGNTSCAAGVQTGFECDGFGTCVAGGTTGCAPYTCADATQCAATCGSDAQCVATAFCSASTGTCVSDQVNGATCISGQQCISGNCVDGVCCDTACTGTCQACSAVKRGDAGADGACGVVVTGGDPDGECPADDPNSCQRDGTCDGAGRCAFYASGAACGSTSCSSGTQVGFACNGLGTCAASASSTCAPYTCQGAVCGSACVADGDCVATHHCRVSDGTCQPDATVGTVCTASTQCLSGQCVDGVCCDSPCAGICEACSMARKGGGVDGECGAVADGTDPDAECVDEGAASCQSDGQCSGVGTCRLYRQGSACGSTTCAAGTQTGYACDGLGACVAGQSQSCAPYLCQGSTCGDACASDGDCLASHHCTLAGVCAADLVNGGACTGASQCVSGQCADAVCCDTACVGTCRACSAAKKGQGQDGVCDTVVLGADPDNDCDVEAPATCGKNGQCDGSGQCGLWNPGTSCGANSCSGSLQTGQQCDGFGLCVSGATVDCSPYLCLGSGCGNTCADDAGCVPTAWCSAGACQARVDNGVGCTAGNQCRSGFCVEGVCCDTACNGTCQSCTAANKVLGAGADGVCGLAAAGVDPQSHCPDEGPTQCKRDGLCDGQGACRTYAAGTACGATDCVAGDQTGFACDGFGTCLAGQVVTCAPFGCELAACLSTCAADQQCATGHYCDEQSGECRPLDADGSICAEGTTCASGYCVDGVCCDGACSGQCQACDLPTARGTCSPVVGAPHGQRPACDPGATGQPCSARTCDGTQDTASCVGYVGAAASCRDQGCATSTDDIDVETFGATCNGQGQCGTVGAATNRSCSPYRCAADALTCASTCTVDGECAVGNVCRGGVCTSGATCLDEVTVVGADGLERQCTPFLCVAGACQGFCASSADCARGYVCDTSQGNGVCTAPRGGAASGADGGCGCRVPAPGSAPRAALVALGVVFVAGMNRRRRARRSDPQGGSAPRDGAPRSCQRRVG